MNLHLPQASIAPGEFISRASRTASGGIELSRPGYVVPHLAIACTLRSGSNLFCEMLRVNGFGNPKEWFQMGGPHIAGTVGLPVAANVGLLTLQTEQFLREHDKVQWRGMKWGWRQFQRVRKLAPLLPEAASILQAFKGGKWFLLRRRDLAAQAVSLYAAQMTDSWMGEDTAEYRRLEKDFDGIYERFAELSADSFSWDSFLSAGPVCPMRVFYEDLVSGDPDIWLRVMRYLDPAFEAGRLNLEPLQKRRREHRRIRELKSWFRDEVMAGRQPRSARLLLEEISRTVARVEGQIPVDGLLAQLTADLHGSPNAFRVEKLDIRKDLRRDGAATLIEGSQFTDRISLRMDPPAICDVQVTNATRVLLQLHAHSWSGIAEITAGDRTEEIDLFTTRTDMRHVIYDFPKGFTGTIAVRCTGAKNMLSRGAEVWLHRVMVLSAL